MGRDQMNEILVIGCSPEIPLFFGGLDPFRNLKNLDFFLMPSGTKIDYKRRLKHVLKFVVNLPRFLTKYDVFIFTDPYLLFLSVPILKFFKKTVAVTTIDAYSEIAKESLWPASFQRKILRKLFYPFFLFSEVALAKLGDVNFCVSKYLFNKHKKLGGKNVYYTPNGADVELISKIEPKKMEKDYIFYMGGLVKWRGTDLLVKALEIVRKKHDIKLVLAGGWGGGKRECYPELVKLLNKMKDEVIYLGYLPHEEAISYLKGAKIAVMPNRDTIFSRTISSIKVFEHIAAEVPQVCTDSGEHAAWVRKLNVGIVTKDRAEDIARGILRLLEDEKLYNALKGNCRKQKWKIDYRRLRGPWIKYLENITGSRLAN